MTNNIEPFEIDSPLTMYEKNNMDINEFQEENSNDNIIFQDESRTDQIDKKMKKAYCGIRGDSEKSCILNVVVSAIGGGCFSFPFIMYEGGILVSLFIFFFVTFSVYYSVDLLRSFVVDTKYFSFTLMTEKILGHKWLRIYAFSSFIIYTSMEVSYLSSIFIYVKRMYNLSGALFNILYFIISMLIEIIICLYITKIANMHYLSIISIFCFLLMLFSLIIVSLYVNISGKIEPKFTKNNLFFPYLSRDNFINIVFKISSYIMVYTYAYSYHSTFPTLLGSLYNVNHLNTKKVHKISFGIISMAYLLLTIFGFILSNKVPNEIFQEKDDFFNEDWKTIKRPFQYCLIIFLLFLIPIRFIVLRDNYITLIGKRKVTFFKELTIVGIFLLICNILVFCIAEFDEYLEKFQIKNTTQAFGGIFGVVISFVLPVINYSSVNGKKKIKSIIGYTILAFYILISILSSGHTIYQIFVGDDKK